MDSQASPETNQTLLGCFGKYVSNSQLSEFTLPASSQIHHKPSSLVNKLAILTTKNDQAREICGSRKSEAFIWNFKKCPSGFRYNLAKHGVENVRAEIFADNHFLPDTITRNAIRNPHRTAVTAPQKATALVTL